MDTIFISYRREESAGHAGRIYDRLCEKFGKNRVFMDVSAIEPGVDFVEAIDRAVGSCSALLVIIGRSWLQSTDATGRRRLDDPRDFIRLEVATALNRNIRVIPVLVQDATMPVEECLPEELKLLARRNAIEINDTHWDSDLAQLVEILERILVWGKGPAPATIEASAKSTAPGRKRSLTWLIGSITAVVIAMTGLLTSIESFRDSVVRLFRGGTEMTTINVPSQPSTAVAVPKVIGLPEQEAVKILRNAGFSPSTEKRISSDVQPGLVFHQEPPPGAGLTKGAGVILHVAEHTLSPPVVEVAVPNVVGQTLEKARNYLKDEGLSWEIAGRSENSDVPPGTVLRTFPKSGDKLKRGGTVRLVMAIRPSAPASVKEVTVPDVVGQTLEKARNYLKDEGLSWEIAGRNESSDVPPGTVLRTFPKSGDKLKRGGTVRLVMAVRPEANPQSPPNISPISPNPPQLTVQGEQILVRCTASPHSIPAGGVVKIRVLAFTKKNYPVGGASVRIEAGGGWFSLSGTTAEIGQTDTGGVFMTKWRAPNPAARGYGMGATANKSGFTEGSCEFTVPIQ